MGSGGGRERQVSATKVAAVATGALAPFVAGLWVFYVHEAALVQTRGVHVPVTAQCDRADIDDKTPAGSS